MPAARCSDERATSRRVVEVDREAGQHPQVRRQVEADPELQRSDHAAHGTAPGQRPQHAANVTERGQALGCDERNARDDRELHQEAVRRGNLRRGQHVGIHHHVRNEDGEPEQAEGGPDRMPVRHRVVHAEQRRGHERAEGEHADQAGGIALGADRLDHRVRRDHHHGQREQLEHRHGVGARRDLAGPIGACTGARHGRQHANRPSSGQPTPATRRRAAS